MSNHELIVGLLKAVVGILLAIFLVMLLAQAVMDMRWM